MPRLFGVEIGGGWDSRGRFEEFLQLDESERLGIGPGRCWRICGGGEDAGLAFLSLLCVWLFWHGWCLVVASCALTLLLFYAYSLGITL